MAGFLDENAQRFPHGRIEEIFNIPIGALVLMDYDEGENVNNVVTSGSFSVSLIMRAACHILACVCSLSFMQWPVTKDTVIARMAKRTFVFALPGLLYGLQFPPFVADIFIENLVTVFKKFGHYKDLINESQQGYPPEDNTANFWSIMRPQIEPMAHEALTLLGQPAGKSRFNIANWNSCYQRAIRLSAITRFVTESMVGTAAAFTMDHLVSVGSEAPHEEQPLGVLYASVNVFTCLVDSIELLWIVICAGLEIFIHGVLEGAEIHLHGTRHDNIGFCLWSVNEAGLMALLRFLMPSNAIGKEKEKGNKKEEEGEASTSANSNGNNIIEN